MSIWEDDAVSAYERGKLLSENLNSGMEEALLGRYEKHVPGLARTIVEHAYGSIYAREGLDLRTRLIATVAALAALGAHTRPQLKVNIASALKTGATQQEICEVIWQMSLYGGTPAAINALNAALEVFNELEVGHKS
jgi:4-carboxymuconolactone decarboxylase